MFVRSFTFMFMQSSWASGSSCEWPGTNYRQTDRQTLTRSEQASPAPTVETAGC